MFDWPREVQALLRTVNQRVFFCGSSALFREFVECVQSKALRGVAVDTTRDSLSRTCCLGAIDAVFTDGSFRVDCAGSLSDAGAAQDVFGMNWRRHWSPPYVSMCVYL